MVKVIVLNVLLLFSFSVSAQQSYNINFYGEIVEPSCLNHAYTETDGIKLTSACAGKGNKTLVRTDYIYKNMDDFKEFLPDNKGTIKVESLKNDRNKKIVTIEYT